MKIKVVLKFYERNFGVDLYVYVGGLGDILVKFLILKEDIVVYWLCIKMLEI